MLLVIVVTLIGLITIMLHRDDDKKPIKIGSISALTGVGVAIGEEERKGALLAVEEINQRGGILGRKLELISEDISLDKLKNVVAVSQKLINVDKVVAIIGPQWDEPAYPMLPIIESAKVPTVGADNSPMLEESSSYEYFFSTWYDNRVGIRELLRFSEERGVKKIAIIKPIAGGFWEYTARIMNAEAPKYGITITDEIDMGNPISLDFKTPLLKAKQKNPDAIFIVSSDYNQCPFLKQLEQIGFAGITLGTESSGDPTSLSQCGELLEKRYFSTPIKTRKYEDFSERFRTRFGHYPKFPSAGTAYDAVMVIADSLKRSNLKGGESLRDAIASTSSLGGVALDPISFDSIGFIKTPENAFEIQTTRDGKFVRLGEVF